MWHTATFCAEHLTYILWNTEFPPKWATSGYIQKIICMIEALTNGLHHHTEERDCEKEMDRALSVIEGLSLFTRLVELWTERLAEEIFVYCLLIFFLFLSYELLESN